MTQEEKAKAYDKAVEKIKYVMEHGVSPVLNKEDIQDIFPQLKESKDEKIIEVLIDYFNRYKEHEECGIKTFYGIPTDNIIDWLEKQGKHANFRNKIQIGDKVTRNQDGVLVNLSQLKRVAVKENKGNKVEISPNSEWSEEDERNLQGIIDEIEANKHNAPDYDLATYERFLSWLKSLKERYTLKPSDVQMKLLKEDCDQHWEPDGLDPLYTLYQDLKKLRGE